MTIDRIIAVCAERFGTTSEAIRGATRTHALTRARHVAMLLARELTRASYPELGRAFGRRDHSTVINGVRRAELAIATDEALRREVDELRRGLDGGT